MPRAYTHGVVVAALVALLPLGCAVDEADEISSDTVEMKGGIEPIIFVHGCPRPPNVEAAAAAFFVPLKNYLLAHGYPSNYLYQFVHVGPVCESAIDQAEQLADLVQSVRLATHAPRVSIIAHSFGGFVARYYLSQGGNRYVRDFATVGAPHHGTFAAAQGLSWQLIYGYPAYEGVQEMFPPYACEGQTYGGSADIQFVMNGCLTPTGRTVDVDETPDGGPNYLSIRNTLGQEVQPPASACLNQQFQNDCSDIEVNKVVTAGPAPGPCGPPGTVCPADLAVMWNPTVIEMLFRFVTHADD